MWFGHFSLSEKVFAEVHEANQALKKMRASTGAVDGKENKNPNQGPAPVGVFQNFNFGTLCVWLCSVCCVHVLICGCSSSALEDAKATQKQFNEDMQAAIAASLKETTNTLANSMKEGMKEGIREVLALLRPTLQSGYSQASSSSVPNPHTPTHFPHAPYGNSPQHRYF